jgi:hypothetical protein
MEEASLLKLRFEHRGQPLAPPAVYHRRLASQAMITAVFIVGWWAVGTLGYHFIAGVPGWIDSFYNAAMILGGMGPVAPEITRPVGKLFASFYAVISGVLLIASVGYLLTPVFHRLIHRFHLESEDS